MNNVAPNFGLVFWTIIIGLIIASAYIALKKTLLSILGSDNAREKVLNKVEYIERLFWPIFLLIIGLSLILSHTIVGLSLCLFTVSTFWKPLSNYFTGLIYRLGKNYNVGQPIRYDNRKGTIKAFKNLNIEMELEDGEYLDIPYSHFADAAIIRTVPKSGIMSYAIHIPIAKNQDLEKEKQRIKTKLISLPWVLPNQKIAFEQGKEEIDRHLLKVIIQGIDKNQLYKVEKSIRAMYPASNN